MRILLALLLVSQMAYSQVLIGIKAPKTTSTSNPPPTPTLLTPTNGVDSVSTTITLAWSPVDSADTYTVNLATDTGFTSLTVNWTTTGVSCAVSGLDSGSVYYWRVRSNNLTGSSAWASRWSFTTITGSVPIAPILVSPALAEDSVAIDPLLSWVAVATATSYKVQLSLANSFISTLVDTTVTGTSIQIDTLSYNTTYYWRVRATNTIGTGAYSSTYFVTTPLISLVRPAPVTTLAAYNTDTSSISLRWIAVGDDSLTGTADHYDLRRSNSTITEANWSSATQLTGEPTPKSAGAYDSLTVTGLTPNTQYYFALKVYDDTTGISAISNVATATTDTTPVTPLGPGYPNAVTTLAVDSTSPSSLYLSWTATGDDGNVGTATSYDIRYSTRKASTGELITNGAFNTDINGWQLVNENGAITWDEGGGRLDGGALAIINSASYSGVVFPISNTDADSATVSMWIYPTYRDTIDLYVLDQNSQILGGSSQRFLQPGIWNYVTRTIATNGLQTQIRPGFNFDPGVSNNTIRIDDASCTVGVAWTSLTQVTGEPTPSVSGTLEHYTLSGLSENTRYYAALKVIDDSSNTSGMSNVVSGLTDTHTDPQVEDTTESKPLITSGTLWVGKHGSNSNSGQDSLHAYLTISKAVSVASAGDTIVVLSGTYAERVIPTAMGTETNPIVLAGYGNQLVTITGSSSASSGNCLYVDADWWVIHNLTFQDQTRATSDYGYYWVFIPGYHNTMRWCRFTGEPNAVDNRLLYFNGRFTTIRNSYFRGGSEGVVLDGPAPRYYLFHRDTINNSLNNNLILGGADAVEGVYHAGIVQYCVLDTAGEDNIQLQNNGAAELSNNGIIIRNNILANAQENCIDMKSCGPTVAVEDNVLVNSYGNDTSAGDDDSGGAGIELGAQDVCRYGIVRFNIIGGNHTGSRMYPGFHIFNNTFYNNSHSYRGFNSTSSSYSGLETDNVSENGEWKRLINNIFYDESGSSNRWSVRIIKANASKFEINNNLYYQTGGSARFETNYPNDWENPDTYTGLSAWQTALTASAFDGWTGKDAASIESNPDFVDVPSNPGAYDASWNFALTDSSPAVDAGKALTTATNSGTNSTSLTVSDPYFFRSDYGIPSFYSGVTGDSIQIGSTSPVEITAVNYSTSTLTLSAQRTWSNGAEIWLWKDGRKVNDIGAKQRD